MKMKLLVALIAVCGMVFSFGFGTADTTGNAPDDGATTLILDGAELLANQGGSTDEGNPGFKQDDENRIVKTILDDEQDTVTG